MVIWFIVGLSIVCVWIWSLLLMYAVSNKRKNTGRHEQKLSSMFSLNTQTVDGSKKRVKNRTSLIPNC